MSFRLDVDDADYLEVTGQSLPNEDGKVLGSVNSDSVMEHFPRLVANRLKKMIPSGFTIVQIQLEFEIAGKVGGSGVSGKGTVLFGPAVRQ